MKPTDIMKTLLLIAAIFAIAVSNTTAQNPITLESKWDDQKNLNYTYHKNEFGSYTLVFTYTEQNNCSTPSEVQILSTGIGTANLFTIKPTNDSEYPRVRFTYRTIKGTLDEKPDYGFTYLLPFKEGVTSRVNTLKDLQETYFNKAPKDNPLFGYSFEFNQPETICAVRRGIVTEVINKYKVDNRKGVSYSSSRNCIEIEHPDGTRARYTGFHPDKIFVKPGDFIYANSEIGVLSPYSGEDNFQLRLLVSALKSENNDKGYDYFYIIPKFLTEHGLITLERLKSYKAKVDEEVIFCEMKKREIKKYKQNQD